MHGRPHVTHQPHTMPSLHTADPALLTASRKTQLFALLVSLASTSIFVFVDLRLAIEPQYRLAPHAPLFESDVVPLVALGVLGLMWASPLTAAAGMQRHPLAFKVYMPFEGGALFVAFQSFGWMLCVQREKRETRETRERDVG